MAVEISKYKAADGREFESLDEANKYERDIERLENAVALLKPIPKNDGCNFSNGEGFVQQDAPTVRKAKEAVIEIARSRNPDNSSFGPWAEVADGDVPGYSGFARILDECDSLVYRYWSRFMCIDKQFREWGQPYYALNPSEGKQVEVSA
jgi:hypothetical protein